MRSGAVALPRRSAADARDPPPISAPATRLVSPLIQLTNLPSEPARILAGSDRPARRAVAADCSTDANYRSLIERRDPVLYIYSADQHFESKRDSQIGLRSSAMVEAQHPTEPLGTFDGAEWRFGAFDRFDQPIVDPLVIPLPMIMSGVLASDLSQRSFSEEDHSTEALILDRSDESLGVGVQVGRAVGQADGLDGEEVGGGEHVPMGLEELVPRRSLAPLGSGIDAVVFKDVADRGASNSMAHIPERSLDSRVAPSGILSCHADDQLGDDLHDPRSAGGMTLVRPLLSNQLPVPSKDGVGSDERRNLGERPAGRLFCRVRQVGAVFDRVVARELGSPL